MFDTDEVAVGRLGIRLSQGQFRALGLQEGSTAWGVWVEGRGGREKMMMPVESGEEFDPGRQGPHLVVSTIHPDSWPSAMRIEARLSRDQSALQRFITDLKELGANVLSLDTSIRGFDLMVVEIFVSVPALTAIISGHYLKELDRDVEACATDEAGIGVRAETRKRCFKNIGELMLSCVAVIEACLRHRDAVRVAKGGDRAGYFHRSSRTLGHQSWFLQSRSVPTPLQATSLARAARLFDNPMTPGAVDYASVLRETAEALAALSPRDDGGGAPAGSAGSICENEDWYAAVGTGDEHAEEVLRGIWQQHAKPAVTVRALPTLAYARVWRAHEVVDGTAKAMELVKLEAHRGLLKRPEGSGNTGGASDRDPGNGAEFRIGELGFLQQQMYRLTQHREGEESEAAERWLGRWTAFASFHYQERSMRFRMLRPWFARKYAWHVEVAYEISRPDGRIGNSDVLRSSGLLASLLEETLRDSGVQIEQLTNSLTYQNGEQREVGRIRMIVIPSKSSTSLVERSSLDSKEFLRRLEEGFEVTRQRCKEERVDLEITHRESHELPLHDALELM